MNVLRLFLTRHLQRLDDDIRNAVFRVRAEEQRVMGELRQRVLDAADAISLVCRTVAVVDVSAALAFAAKRYCLTRPHILPSLRTESRGGSGVSHAGAELIAYGVRHLVVERALLEGWADAFPWSASASAGGDDARINRGDDPTDDFIDRSLPAPPAPPRTFVANDIALGVTLSDGDVDASRLLSDNSSLLPENAADLLASRSVILCGANANGKSTYLRAAAHLAILAQLGSFVPASSARLSVVDRVMARVGASDDVTRSRSTFLLEMEETAMILRTATSHSLVLIDEVGRGTAMADGLAIACAVAEQLTRVGCRLLFATHIHELTALAMAPRRPGISAVRCMAMDVQLEDGVPVLTHRVVLHPVHGLTPAQRIALLSSHTSSVTGATPEHLSVMETRHSAEQASLEAWKRVLGTSHGVHVAALAGLPVSVVRRAREILLMLDQTSAASAWAKAVAQVTATRSSLDSPEDRDSDG